MFLSVAIVLLSRASFCVLLCVICMFCLLVVLVKVVSTSASDWLVRLVSKMTCNVLMGTFSTTQSVSARLVMYSVLAGLCISGPYSIDKMRRYGWLWQMCEMLSLQLVTVFILVETVLNIFISVSFCMYRKHIIITCSLFTNTGVVSTLMYRYCRRQWGQ